MNLLNRKRKINLMNMDLKIGFYQRDPVLDEIEALVQFESKNKSHLLNVNGMHVLNGNSSTI